MIQSFKGDDSWGQTFKEAGRQATEGFKKGSDEAAIRNALTKLGPNASARDVLKALTNTQTYGNEAKQQALQNYLGVENFVEMQRKATEQEGIAKERNRIAGLGKQEVANREQTMQGFMDQGFTKDESEALTNPHVPNSVKQGISRRVEGEISRGQRKPPIGQVPEQPVTPEQEAATQESPKAAEELQIEGQEIAPAMPPVPVTPVAPKKDEWPKLPTPPNTTAAEQEKWRDKNQTFNNKLLKETKDKDKSHTNSLIRYNRLSALNDSGKLPSGLASLVLNPSTGEPWPVASLIGVVNTETQNFVKTMNDFMIDAKSYFGSRVTNFDVQAFKSRLPTLLNTQDGRRLIIEQMKLMEDLQIVHDNELEKGLKHYGRNASYSDIQNIVDERTEEKEARIIDKINNLDSASNYLGLMGKDPRFKNMLLMQSPEGKFKAVPRDKIMDAEAKGYMKW